MIRHFALLLALVVAACGGLPKHKDYQLASNPTLLIVDAPIGASVFVDDTFVAEISKSKQVVNMEPGTHSVVIRQGSNTLYEREVFLQGNSQRKIDL